MSDPLHQVKFIFWIPMLIDGFNETFIMFIFYYVDFLNFFLNSIIFFGICVSGLSSTKTISLISFDLTSSLRLLKIH